MIWKIWIFVPILYALFSLWYFNWRGPITPEEIESFMTAFDELERNKHTDALLKPIDKNSHPYLLSQNAPNPTVAIKNMEIENSPDSSI